MTGLQNSSNPSLADFDWRRFARDVRRKVQETGLALRPLAPEIGVTFTDLSRVTGGQMVGTGKVIALCNAFGLDLMAYYIAPEIALKNKVLQLASRGTTILEAATETVSMTNDVRLAVLYGFEVPADLASYVMPNVGGGASGLPLKGNAQGGNP